MPLDSQVLATDLRGGTEPAWVVADTGYHSNQVLVDLAELDGRSTSPSRRARPAQVEEEGAARAAVYANRRWIRGARGHALQRQRSERLERPNAHLYETGGMRRTRLRGHTNILKRLLVHMGGFNLGLFMRTLLGVGTPRGLQGRAAALLARLMPLWTLMVSLWRDARARLTTPAAPVHPFHGFHAVARQLVTPTV